MVCLIIQDEKSPLPDPLILNPMRHRKGYAICGEGPRGTMVFVFW